MPKLNIELNPVLKTYQNSAFPFSVLLAQDPDTIYFALNNFTQLYFRNSTRRTPFNFNYIWFKYWKCIDIHDIIRNDYMKKWNLSIVDCIKHSIDSGGYIYAIVNEFFVPHRKAYQKFNNDHDILVYGYDDDKLFVIGYDEKVHYTATEISYENFEKAYYSVKSCQYTIVFANAQYYKCKFDPDLNIQLISDYLTCQNTSFKYPFIIESSGSTKWGMDAIMAMLEYSKNSFINEEKLNLRFFDTYLEHKYLMKLRLGLLSEQFNCRNLHNEYEEVYNEATAIKNFVIKLNLSRKKSNFDKLEHLVLDNLNKEKAVLENLIEIYK